MAGDCQSLMSGRFSDSHEFEKPNDENALKLMNRCAEEVMKEFQDLILAYGQSDEYRSVGKNYDITIITC
jgi:tRNA(His) guanylyltransferase